MFSDFNDFKFGSNAEFSEGLSVEIEHEFDQLVVRLDVDSRRKNLDVLDVFFDVVEIFHV